MKIEEIRNFEIKMLVGAPGVGKTSTAQWIVMDNVKDGISAWSTMPLAGAYELELDDLMKFDLSVIDENGNKLRGGVLILDEAGIDFNGRQWKMFSMNFIRFFKLHRHFKLDIYVFSQANDVDPTIKRLAQQWYKLVKLEIPFISRLPFIGKILRRNYTQLIPVKSDLVIENGQWIIRYEADTSFFSSHIIPIYKTWGLFDSYDVPDLPMKDWTKWSELPEEEKNEERLKAFLSRFKKETEEEREEEIQKYAEMSKEELFEEMNRSEENE